MQTWHLPCANENRQFTVKTHPNSRIFEDNSSYIDLTIFLISVNDSTITGDFLEKITLQTRIQNVEILKILQ